MLVPPMQERLIHGWLGKLFELMWIIIQCSDVQITGEKCFSSRNVDYMDEFWFDLTSGLKRKQTKKNGTTDQKRANQQENTSLFTSLYSFVNVKGFMASPMSSFKLHTMQLQQNHQPHKHVSYIKNASDAVMCWKVLLQLLQTELG